jgi:glycine/serine hydroxymethyltransferase
MKEKEIKIISRVLKEAIVNKDNEKKLKSLRKEILKMCKKFPIYV